MSSKLRSRNVKNTSKYPESSNSAGLTTEQKFLKCFRQLAKGRSAEAVWDDMVSIISCTISNSNDPAAERWLAREKEYFGICRKYDNDNDKIHMLSQLFAYVMTAYIDNPEQDFLGSMYMELNIGRNRKAKGFTSYDFCRKLWEMTLSQEETEKQIECQDRIVVLLPCCDAGGTMLASSHRIEELGYDPVRQAIYEGISEDPVVAKMCYIQAALAGLPARIIITKDICKTMNNSGSRILEGDEISDVWYTPEYWNAV